MILCMGESRKMVVGVLTPLNHKKMKNAMELLSEPNPEDAHEW